MTALVVVGTGALANSVLAALAMSVRSPLSVAVVSGDVRRAEQTAYVVNACASAVGSPVLASGHQAPADGAGLRRLLAGIRPAGLVVCASRQSPWERRRAPSAWTRLLSEGGFALSLPFQAAAARRYAEALRDAVPDAWLINGCFPDAVNPLLAALGHVPLCGIGNVSAIEQSLRASLGLTPADELRVLAHHWHLGAEVAAEADALAFVAERRVEDVPARLAAQRACDRVELCRVTGAAAARLLTGLLAGEPVSASVPGPIGLPGGYPVRIDGPRPDAVRLDLPIGLTEAEAIRRNREWALLDGGGVEDGRVVFGVDARRLLEKWLPALAGGFDVAGIDEAESRFTALRDRLRGLPAAEL